MSYTLIGHVQACHGMGGAYFFRDDPPTSHLPNLPFSHQGLHVRFERFLLRGLASLFARRLGLFLIFACSFTSAENLENGRYAPPLRSEQ